MSKFLIFSSINPHWSHILCVGVLYYIEYSDGVSHQIRPDKDGGHYTFYTFDNGKNYWNFMTVDSVPSVTQKDIEELL